jgi:hypothetical protein
MRLSSIRDSRKILRRAADCRPIWAGATCGYNCHSYSEAIALRMEKWINGGHSGKQISRMFRNLH